MSLVALFLYPGFIIGAFAYLYLRKEWFKKTLHTEWKAILLILVSFMIVGNLLLTIFYSFDQQIYYFDFAAYWKNYIDFSNFVFENPKYLLVESYYTSTLSDYGKLPALFLVLPSKIFGLTFKGYVMSIFNFFILPSMFFSIVYLSTILKKVNAKFSKLAFIPLLLCVSVYIPMIVGYVGSAGLVFIAVTACILYDYEKIDVIDSLILVLVVIALAFTRRWYLFFIVAFFLSWGFMIVIDMIRDKKFNIMKFKHILITGLTSLIIVVVFFNPYVVRVLTNNFSVEYSAYKLPTTFDDIMLLITRFGGLVTGLFVYAFYVLYKEKEYHRESAYHFMIVLSTFVMFVQIQSFDTHHMYLLIFSVMYFVVIGLQSLYMRVDKRWFRVVCALVLSAGILVSFVPREDKGELNRGILFSSYYHPPRVNNVWPIKHLATTLNELTRDGSYVYLNASNAVINSDMVRNANLPEVFNSVPLMEYISVVDKRDGFPNDFHKIEYVVVVIPNVYNMGEENQHVMRLIDEGVTSVEVVARHYDLVERIQIDPAFWVEIYLRNSELSKEAENYFESELKKVYPNLENVYHVDFTY